MKIKIFQADKGDCNLIQGEHGTTILVDGGMASSFREHAAPFLSAHRDGGGSLDLVCVSHNDEDHIAGILDMLDSLVEWRVFGYRNQRGPAQKPTTPRPPEIASIWHNAFSDQVPRAAGRIEHVLSEYTRILSITQSTLHAEPPELMRCRELITSKRQAVRLSYRINAKQLNIPKNEPFAGDPVSVENGGPVAFGDLTMHILGPSNQSLQDLQREWEDWLRRNEELLSRLQVEAVRDEARLANNLDQLLQPVIEQADTLGRRERVTTPNLASIIFLVEEGGKRLIMTGDGHAQDILSGLKKTGNLLDSGGVHVDALKLQHHGSEHNADEAFFRAVSADHYIICANGAHENPNLDILEALIKSRLGREKERTTNVPQDKGFTIWINSSEAATREPYREHMQAVERLIRKYASSSGGIMEAQFLGAGESSLELSL